MPLPAIIKPHMCAMSFAIYSRFGFVAKISLWRWHSDEVEVVPLLD
jgi:hypothetical protein